MDRLAEALLKPMLAALVVGLLALSTIASAAEPTGSTGSSGPTAVVPIAAVPDRSLLVSFKGVYRANRRSYILAGERIIVVGRLRGYVAGDVITVRLKRSGRTAKTRRVVLRSGSMGKFRVRLKPSRVALYSVSVSAKATAAGDSYLRRARAKRVRVLSNRFAFGERSRGVRIMQRRLSVLGYVVPRSGVMDAGTGRALLAVRKVAGLKRIEYAGAQVVRKLANGSARYRLKHRAAAGRHVEVDLSRQVMVLARGNKVERIYHVSTGAPATPTVLGTYRFYRKDFGTNQKGMVHSAYFIRGYATHGFASVPIYPASHGCVRVPIPNAASIFRWIQQGDRIDVYR